MIKETTKDEASTKVAIAPNTCYRNAMSKPDVICQYCKIKTKKVGGYTRDHVIPKSKGGINKGNLVHCCKECNQFKNDLSLKEWLKKIEELIENKMQYKNYSILRLGQIRKSIKLKLKSKATNSHK